LTATVSPVPPASATPTGKVTILDGNRLLGVVDLSNGQAILSLSNLAVGNHAIHVLYGGDIFYAPSAASVVIQKVHQDPTTTALTSSADPSTFGQAVTFTAKVTVNSPFTAQPTGKVNFYDGNTFLGSGMLDASGQADFITALLTVGQHHIRALYVGNSQVALSMAALLQTVN
jgi:hypothetical protein